jgi:hypothetical protein
MTIYENIAYTIYVVLFSVTHNISMTTQLPDRFGSYFECAYWASSYKSVVNSQNGPVQVRSWECREA